MWLGRECRALRLPDLLLRRSWTCRRVRRRALRCAASEFRCNRQRWSLKSDQTRPVGHRSADSRVAGCKARPDACGIDPLHIQRRGRTLRRRGRVDRPWNPIPGNRNVAEGGVRSESTQIVKALAPDPSGTAGLRLIQQSTDAGEAAALVLTVQEFVASGGGWSQFGAAALPHRRGGRGVVAVSVGVAVGVPEQSSRRRGADDCCWAATQASNRSGRDNFGRLHSGRAVVRMRLPRARRHQRLGASRPFTRQGSSERESAYRRRTIAF
jgi:hypothetical protein